MLSRLVGPIALVAIAVAMLAWTWGGHTEPLVDFGREIYTAWRLSAGDVLYRDIEYFNGPVSPYLNALLFKIFGPTLLHLQISNLIEWSILCSLSYRFYTAIADRLAAFAAVTVFITVFSFLQLNTYPIFNYVSPYAHEITQSFCCAMGIFALLHRWLIDPRRRWLALIGVLLGIVFMMKVEVTIAISAAVGVVLLADVRRTRLSPRQWMASVGIVAGGAIMPIAIAWSLLRLAMPAGDAMRGVLGSWKFIFDSRLTRSAFYLGLSGFDRPGQNSLIMLAVLGIVSAMLLPAMICSYAIDRRKISVEARVFTSGCGVAVVLAIACLGWGSARWEAAARPLNILTAITLIGLVVVAIRQTPTPRSILQLSFAIFATLMLSKVLLTVPAYHYGFVLTVPAMSLFVMASVCWIPEAIHRRGGSGWIFRSAVLTVLACFCARHLALYATRFQPRMIQRLGDGENTFRVDRRAVAIQQAIDFLDTNAAPADTLAVEPHGAMINFLTHRINPTGELVLLPGEVAMFGEKQVVGRFQQHPPDWIVTVKADVGGFGVTAFGVDYAAAVGDFIRANYRDATPTAWESDSPVRVLKRGR